MAKRVRPHSGLNDRKAVRSAAPSAQSGQNARAASILPPAPQIQTPPAPAAEAVALFERGMQALQQHAFSQAAEHFHALLDKFPAERGLRDRSQVYLSLCER